MDTRIRVALSVSVDVVTAATTRTLAIAMEYLTGDCRCQRPVRNIEIPFGRALLALHMDETPCRVTAVRELGPDDVAIDLESPDDFSAQPGQFVKLTFDVDGEEVSRFYTISSPNVVDTFELTIEIDPEGDLGPALAAVSEGDELTVSGPFGRDYYEGEPRVVVVAGGPGVGPAVGIAERAIADGGEAAVVYRDEKPLHEERLVALADAGAFVEILSPAETLEDAVSDALDAGEAEAQLFVYGFADFIDDATGAIEAAGADAGDAKIENFG